MKIKYLSRICKHQTQINVKLILGTGTNQALKLNSRTNN